MGGSTARKNPIGSAQQEEVGPSGVATGHGAFNLSSSISAGDEENPHCWSFTLLLKFILESIPKIQESSNKQRIE
ncbi:hypothetical protein [Rummeliibacillus suwonensis]|uniref:hypothetical protein n=1 Tax=Rummeliibacillus suwonensis TaxID=1306154 RepID=UPI0011B80622|nr:hypothetical protein [Rummeliibacillus suwonensis]